MSNRTPTNTDLMREIREIKAEVHDVRGTIAKHDSRINSLEIWRTADDIAKKAVEAYKRDHKQRGQLTQKDIFTAVLKLIGVIATLVAIIAGGAVVAK